VSPGGVDSLLIPGAIKTRLYVITTDPDWKKRVKAAVEGRPPAIALPEVGSVAISVVQWGTDFIIELRPRAGSIFPIFFAVPIANKSLIKATFIGPPGATTHLGNISQKTEGPSTDGAWWTIVERNEAATPTRSFYVQCSAIPLKVVFGQDGGQM